MILTIVWRRRWLLGSILVLAIIVALLVTMVLPRIYEANATIITPKEGGSQLLGGLAIGGLLQQIPGLSMPSLTPNRDLLLGLLKSRTMAGAVVDKFGLAARYRVSHREEAIRRLQAAVLISISREGIITVKTEDEDPQISAQMANFYVEHLERLVSHYSVDEAGRQRRFLTEQLARAKVGLDGAEQGLRRFQEKNRAIVLQEQTRTAIEGVARLQGEMMAAEVQLQVMRNFATEANPDVVMLRRRVDEIKRQLSQIQHGGGAPASAAGTPGREFVVPFARVPEVGLELARLTREVKIQETLVTLLTQQAEQARLTEAKDIPVVQLLDRAVPPYLHVRPRRGLNAAIGAVVGLLVGLGAVFAVEIRARGRQRGIRS